MRFVQFLFFKHALANYSQQEREEYWANWMGISVDDMKKYLH